MKLVLKWDAQVPFYETILNLISKKCTDSKKEDLSTFKDYIVKTYQSDEANEKYMLEKCHDVLNTYLDHYYEDDLMGKYNTMFYIAERIPENRSLYLLETVIKGYRDLIGEQGKTLFAEEKYQAIKLKLASS